MGNDINVVIIDNDINYRKIYMDCVKSLGGEVVLSTSEPMRSLDFVVEKQPKMLIMDIVLPGYDSLEYIRTVKEVSPNTVIIVITHFINDCIENMCIELGVSRYLHKTSRTDIISFVISQYIGFTHIKKNLKRVSDSVRNMNDDLIDEILQNLRLPFHIKGTHYTKVAVKDMVQRNVAFEEISITKDIYPTVAKKCNTTVSRVERSIRYCIEFILENETMDLISPEKYGVNIKGNHKLSNSKFLIILANYVMRQLNLSVNNDDI